MGRTGTRNEGVLFFVIRFVPQEIQVLFSAAYFRFEQNRFTVRRGFYRFKTSFTFFRKGKHVGGSNIFFLISTKNGYKI